MTDTNPITAVLAKYSNIPDFIFDHIAADIDRRLSEFSERQTKNAEELFGVTMPKAEADAATIKPKAARTSKSVALTAKQKAWLTRRQNMTRDLYASLLDQLDATPWTEAEKPLLDAMDDAQTISATDHPEQVAEAVQRVAREVRALKWKVRPSIANIVRLWGIK